MCTAHGFHSKPRNVQDQQGVQISGDGVRWKTNYNGYKRVEEVLDYVS